MTSFQRQNFSLTNPIPSVDIRHPFGLITQMLKLAYGFFFLIQFF